MHQNQRTTVTRMYWDTIGGEKCEINLDPHLSLRPRHSYLDSDTPRLLAYPYLRQMSGSFYGYHAFMHQNQRTTVTRAPELAHSTFLLFHQHHQILSHSGYLLFENLSQKNGILDEWFFTESPCVLMGFSAHIHSSVCLPVLQRTIS